MFDITELEDGTFAARHINLPYSMAGYGVTAAAAINDLMEKVGRRVRGGVVYYTRISIA